MTKRLLAFAIAIMMVAMLAVGCAQNPATPQNTNSPADSSQPENSNEPAQAGNDDVKYKDTIVYATATEQNYMDGQMNNTNDKVLRTVYSSLVMRDSENNIVGDLADHWETSEDGLVWTFYLRQDVKWHNGKQFTSADVKASYDRLLNAENPVRYTSTMSIITGCNVVDDYTVELTTADPCPMMLATLCHRANLILDADYIEKEKEILLAQIKNDPKEASKPEKVIEGMIQGRINKELKEIVLLDQVYVKAEDGKQSVEKYVAEVAKANNANIKIKKFIRFETGEGLEKKNEDFAAEVAKQMGN